MLQLLYKMVQTIINDLKQNHKFTIFDLQHINSITATAYFCWCITFCRLTQLPENIINSKIITIETNERNNWSKLGTTILCYEAGLMWISSPDKTQVDEPCRTTEQPLNGSPVKPSRQEQTGECLITTHEVWRPQDPGHGSRHFSFWHARCPGHSALLVHSGRQLGGRPMYEGRQEHVGVLPLERQTALGPQGEGTHGSWLSTTIGVSTASKQWHADSYTCKTKPEHWG